jgi:hypothetical protein
VKYCPNCGAEYRPGFDTCADCNVALVDDPPAAPAEDPQPQKDVARVEVMRTGRSIDADLATGYLQARGLDAVVWGSGLGKWRLEAGLTEVTGVPSPFNAYRVMVPEDQEDEARMLLADGDEPDEPEVDEEERPARGLLQVLRSPLLIASFCAALLILILEFGAPRP